MWRSGFTQNFRNADAESLRHEWLETVAVAVSRVKRIVISPRYRPVVTAFGETDDRFLRRPANFGDQRTRWQRRCVCSAFRFHRRSDWLEKRLPRIVMLTVGSA